REVSVGNIRTSGRRAQACCRIMGNEGMSPCRKSPTDAAPDARPWVNLNSRTNELEIPCLRVRKRWFWNVPPWVGACPAHNQTDRRRIDYGLAGTDSVLQGAVQESGELGLGQRAHFGGFDVAVLEHGEGRNAPYAVF